jgi:hypothetical protein
MTHKIVNGMHLTQYKDLGMEVGLYKIIYMYMEDFSFQHQIFQQMPFQK